jgi:hypothetical protein
MQIDIYNNDQAHGTDEEEQGTLTLAAADSTEEDPGTVQRNIKRVCR